MMTKHEDESMNAWGLLEVYRRLEAATVWTVTASHCSADTLCVLLFPILFGPQKSLVPSRQIDQKIRRYHV